MRKSFEMEYENETVTEEFNVDYMVLFGKYDNERPESHYGNRKSKGEIYSSIERAREEAAGKTDAKIWEVAHALDSGDIVFLNEIEK